ncbi:MAG: ABC transporter ATP-binding protein [Pseudomonadota bacterium]
MANTLPQASSPASPAALLDVDRLTVDFETRSGTVHALDQVTLSVRRGEVVALVGESGSGKSVSAFAIMGILDAAAKVRGGSIRFDGMELVGASERDLRQIRGNRIAMIFQSARSALNPIQTVAATLTDVIRAHARTNMTDADVRERMLELLRQVRITDPERRLQAYPYELSGGMCQRIMIAAALACRPDMIIADEPTTGLDVTTQSAVMDLLTELSRERGLAMLLVTHDLALASEYCDRVVVMHAGHVVESAPRDVFFSHPAHPYSSGLLRAIPDAADSIDALVTLRGSLPDLRSDALPGCRFVARCERAQPDCRGPVASVSLGLGHDVKCLYPLVREDAQAA